MVHEQAAGFALDALDRDEATEFEEHLRVCPSCEDELERLRTTAAALAFAAELPAPRPALRLRVLDLGAVVVLRRRWVLPALSAAAVAAVSVAIALALQGAAGAPRLPGLTAYPVHGAKGALLVTRSREAVLVVDDLPVPGVGTTYQLWIVRADTPVAAGFLGGRLARLTRRVPPGASVAVSLEPAGGSRRPTGPLLLEAETA